MIIVDIAVAAAAPVQWLPVLLKNQYPEVIGYRISLSQEIRMTTPETLL